jgi:regulatory protein
MPPSRPTEPADPALLLSRAAHYAGSQERCTSQVRRKLADWGAPASAITPVLDRLTAEGLIDDARFAQLYARSKQNTGWGVMKIRAGMRQLALPDALIERALSEATDPDVLDAKLTRALAHKAKTLQALPERDRAARLYRFALQRGYAPAQIHQALGQLSTELPDEPESPFAD